MKERKWYIIGDPAVREKIRRKARITWFSLVYGFAAFGLFCFSYLVAYFLHH